LLVPEGNKNQPADVSLPSSLLSGLHFRGKLPHLKKEGALYFVTFRLNDSLPAHEVARLKHERRVILEQARAAKNPLTWHEEQQLLAWYCDKVEALLDAGHGACWLSKPDVADLVAGALRHFDRERYELRVGGDAQSRSRGRLADARPNIEQHPAQLEIVHEQPGEQKPASHWRIVLAGGIFRSLDSRRYGTSETGSVCGKQSGEGAAVQIS